ncbi:sensor histidine kinase [Natronogracilivirga saccharolytica]|uniref:PAS domain S-box protein n=1 Tax=Natronogracilivirga saccharolytica TaxID=2812953 RepID=A0A8J7RH01_9BACT|nr:PAS domain S-box protein [Natronogracilivirga saccharolytica]MBP3191680.1 PAS domain S-box protein [Natronogracilivirga saccharolytica]
MPLSPANHHKTRKEIRTYLENIESGETPDPERLRDHLKRWDAQLEQQDKYRNENLFHLQERVKELSMLYEVIQCLQTPRPDLNLEHVIKEVLRVIPDGFRLPENTAAVLKLNDKVYQTGAFHPSDNDLVSRKTLTSGHELELRISIAAPDDALYFLKEERVLLDRIAWLVARFYNHYLTVLNLSEREELYRTTLYSVGDAVITTDIFGLIQQVNPVAAELTGWKEEEAIGRQIEEVFCIINEDTREKIENPVGKVLQHGRIVALANHTLLVSRKGREIPIADTGAPIKKENGEITGVVLVFHDQLKERALLNRLEESEEQFRSMVELAPEPIFIQTDHKFAYLNPAAVKLYGAESEHELLGTPVFDHFHPDYHDVIRNRIMRLNVKREKVEELSRQVHIRRDGSHVWVETVGTPIYYEGKEGALVLLRDVSEQVRHEQAARENLKEKEVLLAEVHHRVKNNMAVISGLLELEAEMSDTPEMKEVLKKAESRIRSMALIHEKLYKSDSFAEIDFGAYIIELAGFIQEHYSSDKKRIHMSFDLDKVYLDITRAVPCGIILNELITNGMKYAFKNRSEGTVTIGLTRKDKEAVLEYKDDGTGFGQQVVEDINSGNIRSLGMQLIAGLTSQLKGKMEIGNAQGARVEIRFPVNNS